MSVAISTVAVILLLSMASGTVSTSILFSHQDNPTAANSGNDGTLNDPASLIIQEDGQLAELDQQISRLSLQNSDTDLKFGQAERELTELSSKIEKLETNNSNLESKLDLLRLRYEDITSRYSALQSDYARALQNNSQLLDKVSYYEERTAMQISGTELLENKLAESITPPYTFIKDREIYWVFKNSHGDKFTWNIPFDTYRALIGRQEPQNEKILRSDHGVEYAVRDHTRLVDPSSFSPWVDDIFEKMSSHNDLNASGIDSQFVHESWYIVSELTSYSPDMGEDPRWPLETLVEGGGDCEDFAILMASMLKASSHTKDWQIQMVYFDIEHPDHPETVNHVSLFIKTDHFETFIDRSLDPSKGETWENINGWYFDL